MNTKNNTYGKTKETARQLAKANKQAERTKQLALRAALKENEAQLAKEVKPTVALAKVKKRHTALFISFLLFVLIPIGIIGFYLYQRAADQYVSYLGFSVRNEEIASPVEILGGISELSSGSSSDIDILYEFIQSQQLVQEINSELDLKAIYSSPEDDPIFAFDPDGKIEDLVQYWSKMVKIYYDSGTGLIEIRAHAFDRKHAQLIAQEIFTQSSEMINKLSAIAREDTIQFSRKELDKAIERLKTSRTEITRFRNKYQIVDPNVDIQAQMGVLNTLQQQLAEATIELDLLGEIAPASDPRNIQAKNKIAVINNRISQERRKIGLASDGGGSAFSTVFEEFESLSVDRQFAESAYIAALSSYDNAVSEASKKSKYLAAYVEPTLAEKALYPNRIAILGFSSLFIFLAWAISSLVYYSVRDRK